MDEQIQARAQQLSADTSRFLEAVPGELYSRSHYAYAANMLLDVKKRLTELDETRKEITRPMDRAKRGVMDLFRRPQQALEAAESRLKDAMVDFLDAQDRRAADDHAKVLAELNAEVAAFRVDLDEAVANEDHERAERLRREIQTRELYRPMMTVPQLDAEGIQVRETYSVDVVDFRELVRAVAAGLVPLEALQPDRKFISERARTLGGAIDYAGVVVQRKRSIAASRSSGGREVAASEQSVPSEVS